MITTAPSSDIPVVDVTDFVDNFFEYQEKYDGKIIGFKFGGALAEDMKIVREIARQCAIMCRTQQGPLLFGVHGGGKQIDKALEAANLEIRKDTRGLRITDPATMQICDRELRDLNGHIVRVFNSVSINRKSDVRAMGLAGYDACILSGTPLDADNGNFTGHITNVDTESLTQLMNREGRRIIPIIYPICHSSEAQETDQRINVNADEVASAIANALQARRLLLLTDTRGILDADKQLISEVDTDEVTHLIAQGVISGGMIPKAEAARDAALKMTEEDSGVVILDGARRSSMLLEIYSEGSGTLVRRSQPPIIQAP